MSSPASMQPGDLVLGKYRVERVLGQGGMGVVVAARHVELHELFAIKLLLPAAMRHPQAVERFVREARAAARLKSENVAKVHDVGRLPDGTPYMLMEYLAGSDLSAHLKQQGPLSVSEAIGHVLQACEAVGEAHALGIVHRDLKPANLFLVRRPNGTPCIKVLDFGISKQASPDGLELTQTRSLLGSPLYMSPEQMMYSKGVDRRTDIWAIGVVLYELVTGRPPFLGETITEVVARVMQETHPSPSFVRGELPPALDAVIDRCLAKRPDDRFSSIEELAQALQSVVAQPATTAQTLVLTEPSPAPPPRRLPLLVILAAAVVIGIFAMVVWRAIPLLAPVAEPAVPADPAPPISDQPTRDPSGDPPVLPAPVASPPPEEPSVPSTGEAVVTSTARPAVPDTPPAPRPGRPRPTAGARTAAPAVPTAPATTPVSPPPKKGEGVL